MTNAIQKRNDSKSTELGFVLDNIFNNTLRRFVDGNLWDIDETMNKGTVPVNVRETDHQYELDVIAPGCRKEDFNIQVRNNELQISFNHDESKKQQDEKAGWVRNEYIQRSFTRYFTLDETVDTSRINASYLDGVLRIVLPKNEKAKPRLVDIAVK